MGVKDFQSKSFAESLIEIRGGKKALKDRADVLLPPTPQELHKIYNKGFQGVKPMASAMKKKWRSMRAAMPKFYDVFPWAKGLGKGKLNAPWLAAITLIKGWGGLYAQVQGDCTVHGTEHGAEIDYCCDCLWGETKFMGPIAFENIYRSRGFNGDGWSCYAPCMYVGPEGKGGFLYRKVYEGPGGEKVDLTKYNSAWQSKGSQGVPEWLAEISRQNKAKWIIPVNGVEEYRDIHAIGCGLNFCSGQAWASSTDENGVAPAKGGWSHAMCHPGNDDREWARTKYSDIIGMIQNSWGDWNTINGKPPDHPDMPTGSWYSRMNSISKLFDGDQFAICGVYGWERTGWEAFDITELTRHLRNSTTQDYYKVRSEKLVRLVELAQDCGVETLSAETAQAV